MCMYYEYAVSAAAPNGKTGQPRAGMMWMFYASEPLFQSVLASRLTFVIKTSDLLVGSLSVEAKSGKTGFFALGRRPSPDLYALSSIPYPIADFPKSRFELELQDLRNYVCTVTFLRSYATGMPPFGDVLNDYARVGSAVRRR